MKERVKFVLEWEKRWNFAELCREFGISRQVGDESRLPNALGSGPRTAQPVEVVNSDLGAAQEHRQNVL